MSVIFYYLSKTPLFTPISHRNKQLITYRKAYAREKKRGDSRKTTDITDITDRGLPLGPVSGSGDALPYAEIFPDIDCPSTTITRPESIFGGIIAHPDITRVFETV